MLKQNSLEKSSDPFEPRLSLIYHDPSMCETKCNKYNNCQKMAVTNGALLELNRDPRLKASRVRGRLAKVFKTLSVFFEEHMGSMIADGTGLL